MMRYLSTIIIFCFGALTLSAAQQNIHNQKTSESQVKDSTVIFNEITDIQQRLKSSSEKFEKSAISHPVSTSDSIIRHPQSIAIYPANRHMSHLDSIYARRADGTLIIPDRPSLSFPPQITFEDTIIINPVFLPVVFNGKMLPDDLTFYPPKKEFPYKGILISPENTFEPLLRKMQFVNEVRKQYFTQYPDKVTMSVFNFNSAAIPTTEKDVIEHFNPFRELIKVEKTAPLEAPPVETVKIGRKYWLTSGEHKLQFSQTYFSDNWYKGGNSNLTINNYHIIRANYQKDKVRFDNTFEWRLSLYTSPDDTLRSYNIGDDMIRYYGSLGLDAFLKKWSYSTNMEIKTQLFNNYPVNSNTLRSAFFSPLNVNMGIGMRYQLDKKSEAVRNRRVRLTLDLSPASINFTYVGNKNVDVLRYGIDAGDKSKFDVGSTLTSILKYDFTRYITWDSRLKYFTSYKNVLTEFENSLNVMLSQYFSTTLYFYMRYDDSAPRDPTYRYFQINEMVSFGLNYKW